MSFKANNAQTLLSLSFWGPHAQRGPGGMFGEALAPHARDRCRRGLC